MKKLFLPLFFHLFLFVCLKAQPISVNNNLTDAALIATLAGPGVTISNVTITGAANAYGQFTNGLNGNPSIGINRGVLMTSGSIDIAVGPNTDTNEGFPNFLPGYALLEPFIVDTLDTHDATVIEFDLTTIGTTLRFDYVFASEEYHNFVNTIFNDVFAFFISGPGITGNENLALLNGVPISVNTINNGHTQNCFSNGVNAMNPEFFVDNCLGGAVQYDGFTKILHAVKTNLQPCKTYHIILAIADATDYGLDSGLFLGESSFTSPHGTAFTTAINCNNGNWSVTATSTETISGTHRWELWATDVEGATTGGSLVSTLNGGTTATFNWLELSKHYYIRHVANVCGTEIETRIAVPDFSDNATASFTLKDENGVERTTFCSAETVFLDGTASSNYDRFFLNCKRRLIGSPTGTPFEQYADYGWNTVDIPMGVLDLSNEFRTKGDNPGELFEAGYEYEIFMAIANPPNCIPWTEVRKTFTVTCCEYDFSAAFTVDIDCLEGNWTVTATPTGEFPVLHQWQLYATTTPGATTGGVPVGSPQKGPIAVFNWLDQSRSFYIKHTISTPGCNENIMFSVAVPTFAIHAGVTYVFEDKNGVAKNHFCVGEDIYLDATGTDNYDRYFMSVERRPVTGGNFAYYADYGWSFGAITGPLNLSHLFANSGDHPGEVFTPGYVYRLQFAIANPPECIPWIEVKQEFTVECCANFITANFQLDMTQNQQGLSLIVHDFPTFGTGVTHQWLVYSSPNPDGGPYTPVAQTTTTGAGPYTLYSQGVSGLYYFVVHKVTSACGQVCYGQRRQGLTENPGGSCELCGEINCNILNVICLAPDNEVAYCNPIYPSPLGVVFTWSAVTGATQYRVEINYNHPSCCLSGLQSTSTYTTLNTNMYLANLHRSCFRWRVGVVCNGQLVWSEYHCFTSCHPDPNGGIGLTTPESGTVSAAGIEAMSVYPNPASDELNVVLPEGQIAESVKITDIQGKVAFEKSAPEQHLKIDSSNFIAGMYAVQVRYADGRQSVKYVVIIR